MIFCNLTANITKRSLYLLSFRPAYSTKIVHFYHLLMSEVFQAAHLLIKNSKSRNPVSRRTGESTANVSEEEAIREIREWAAKIKGGTISFEDAARQRSDCGSYVKGGDLGKFGPGDMMKPFEDAVRSLKPGEMSDVVITDSGAHLIKRIA